MRFTSAMLADAAQVQSGKLFVLGGGFDTIPVRSVPAVHRSLTLAMVAEVDPDERQRDLLAAVRERADALIDTSDLNVHQLRSEIENGFAPGGGRTL